MKAIAVVALLASLFVLASADCGGLSPGLCAHVNRASKSLVAAFETANDVLAEAMAEAAKKRAVLFEASVTIARAHIPAQTPKSVDEVKQLDAKLVATLKAAELSQEEVTQEALKAFEEAASEITGVLQEAIVSARRSDSGVAEKVAFALSDSAQTIESIKQKLEAALKKAHGKVKVIIQKAIDRVNEGLQKVEGFLAKILGEAGVQKVRELLQTQVERLLKAIDDALAKRAAGESQASFDIAVKDTEALIEELEDETRVSKRGITDVWAKVKAAVNKLGTAIKDAAKVAIEKNKPKILKALQETGKALVVAGQEIIIQVINSAVQALVTDLVST